MMTILSTTSLLCNRGGFASRTEGRRIVWVFSLMLFLVFAFNNDTHAQNLVWAKRAGGSGNDNGRGIVVDGAGNTYVTGEFYTSATFGPGEANETVLTSDGENDIFVAKYAPNNGTLQWVKRAGGLDFDDVYGIALDNLGNLYITGRIGVTATFGAGEANETTFIGIGLFVAKFNANDGTLLWAKRTAGNLAVRGIAVDGDGNSYVTGYFQDTMTFGDGEANETTLTSAGSIDLFVVKYDANGMLVWAKRAGGSDEDYGGSIAVDGAGNSYVTGQFLASATFGPGEANEITLSGTGLEIFIAKYDPMGALIWAKRAGGPSGDHGRSITVDGAGNSFVTGSFQESVTFGPGEASPITLPGSTLGHDVFVAKYNSSGIPVWAKATSNGLEHHGRGIALDRAGNIHVTGTVLISAIFGPGEANETTLSGNNYLIFVAKYNGSNGALIWAKGADGEAFKDDFGDGIAVDNFGNSYVTGNFEDSATFGAGEANEITLSGSGDEIFVAKFRGSLSDGVNGAIDLIDDVLAGGGLSGDAIDELHDAQQDLQDAKMRSPPATS